MPLTRREVLIDGAILAVGYTAGKLFPALELKSLQPQPINYLLPQASIPSEWNVEFKKGEPTREDGLSFGIAMGKAKEKVKPFIPEIPQTEEAIQELAKEIIPYFRYEKISFQEVDPTKIKFDRLIGDWNFHILGMADCQMKEDGALTLNARYLNPFSVFNERYPVFSTLAHELGHFNGTCNTQSEDLEVYTQLSSIEVMSAMAREGNPYALWGLLDELETFGLSYAMTKCLEEDNNLDWYRDKFIKPRGTQVEARFTRMMDYWADSLGGLRRVLKRYWGRPYELMSQTMEHPLAITPRSAAVQNYSDSIEMNDTRWMLSNFNQYINDFVNHAK